MTQPASVAFTLQPDLFQQGASGQYRNHYPANKAASISVLRELVKKLGLSEYQVRGLVGPSNPDSVRRWFHGEASPSTIYLLRICKLLLLDMSGVPVKHIRSIDWENSVIKWRNGDVTSVNHLYWGGPALSPPPGPVLNGVADIPYQRPRPPSTYPARRPPVDGG